MLSPGFGVALWELWGGFEVALGGFPRHFYFLLSALCFSQSVALGGFAGPFYILHSSFCLRLARLRPVLEGSLVGASG
jgi:hypothetical protein